MPAATATFSDSAPWASGIATRLADTALSCGRMPAPSLPTMTAIGPEPPARTARGRGSRSEEHTSELQSRRDLVCRLLLEKKKAKKHKNVQMPTNTLYNSALRLH